MPEQNERVTCTRPISTPGPDSRRRHWRARTLLDYANLSDEISSLGRELEREIRTRLEILISYLLKWRHLAEYRGLAWGENIDRQRDEIAELLRENPTLSAAAPHFVPRAYEDGRRRLKYETYFYETDFPQSCPFSTDQIFAAGYFPDDLDALVVVSSPVARNVA